MFVLTGSVKAHGCVSFYITSNHCQLSISRIMSTKKMHVTTKESQHSKKVSALEMCIRHINMNANKHFPGQLCSTLFFTPWWAKTVMFFLFKWNLQYSDRFLIWMDTCMNNIETLSYCLGLFFLPCWNWDGIISEGQDQRSPPTLVLAVLPSRFIDKVISQMGPQ